MTFHVGQRVVCVDAKARTYLNRYWIYNDAPTEGEIYTVAGLCTESGTECIILREHPRHPGSQYAGFSAWRFRPIVEKKTDIGFAHEILREVTRKQTVRA